MPIGNFLKSLIRLTSWGFLYLILICLVLEFGLRLFLAGSYIPPGSDSPKVWQYHSTYGWSGRKNIDVGFRKQSFLINVKHNQMGLRDKNYSTDRTNKNRMLVIGDSFTWCYGVEIENCFVDQLEARFPDWEFINAGIAGTGTDQQYLLLKDLITQLKPDVVMQLVIQNDFQDNLSEENHFYYKPYYTLENGSLKLHQVPVPDSRMDQLLQRWIFGRSYLFGVGSFVRMIVWNKIRTTLGMEPIRFEPYRDFSFKDSLAITQALLQATIDICEEHNTQYVMLHGQMLKFLQKSLRDVAVKNKVPIHNLDRAFDGFEHKQYQIPGDAHWNKLGHELVAKDVTLFLQESSIVQ